MNNFVCKKCGSHRYDLKEIQNGMGVATGLYCHDCQTWHKWVGKQELQELKNYVFRDSSVSPEDSLTDQINQLKKTIAALQDLRDRLKAIKEKNVNIIPEDDMPPWD